jgi:hypothetical protein
MGSVIEQIPLSISPQKIKMLKCYDGRLPPAEHGRRGGQDG